MKLKKVVALSLSMLAGMSLASCGGNGNDTAAYNAGFIKEKTKITLWTIVGLQNQTYLNNYIESFKKLEPNVEIENVKQSTNYNGLATMVESGFSANNYPDLVQAYPDAVSDFLSYGKAVKLDEYMDNTTTKSGAELAGDYADSKYDKSKTYQIGWTKEEKDDIVPAYLAEGQGYVVEGTYSLPFSKSTEAMFYNAGLIGLTIPGVNNGEALTKEYFDNLTWEELFENFCPNFTTYNNALAEDQKILKNDQDYSAIFAYDSDDNLFITLAQQYGYDYTSIDKTKGVGKCEFNNDNMKALMKKWNEYAKKGYIISKGSAGNNYTNTYFTKRNTLFSVGSTGGVTYQFDASDPMDVQVARIPQPKGGSKTAAAGEKKICQINQGPSLAVLDHDDENRRLASWLFYKHITNYENSIDWAINSGYSGIRLSALDSEDFAEAFDESKYNAKTLEKLMARNSKLASTVKDMLYTSPSFKGSAECRTQAGGLMTYALTKDSDMSDSALNAKFSSAEATATLAIGD